MGDRYRKIFEHAASGVLVLDLEGRIQDFNPAACRLMGRERGTIRERPFSEFLGAPMGAFLLEKLKLLPQLGHLTLEASLPGASGSAAGAVLDLTWVPWEDGEAALVILRELGPRERLEHDLALLRQALSALAGPAHAVFLISPGGVSAPFPPREEKPVPELGELDWVRPLLHAPRLKDAVARAWSGERNSAPPAWFSPSEVQGERVIAPASERPPERFLRVELIPMRGPEGAVAHVLAAVTDATRERLEAEDERRRNQRAALASFSSALLSEFNGYLGVILAQASALRLALPPERLAPPSVGAILDAAQQAAVLLRRAGEAGLDTNVLWGAVDLNAAVTEAARVLGHKLAGRVTVKVELGDGVPKVQGDAALLSTMVVAFGRIAEGTMPAGGELRLKTFLVEPPGPAAPPAAGLSLSDTGVGMDGMVRAQSVDSLIAAPASGACDPLDLAFARSVVRQHRGQLELESQPGRGTSWRVVLPGMEVRPRLTGPYPAQERMPDEEVVEQQIARSAAAAPATSESARHSSGAHSAVRPCLLLADDEENFRDFGREVLRKAGYEVVLAADGQEAFDHFQEDPARYGLVILDAYMPRLGGLEAYLRMQLLRPDLPVIFVSGFVRGPSRTALLAACPGKAEVILKPFSGEDLTSTVERTLHAERSRLD